MKPGFLLFVILASVGAIGYLEIRHLAEREAWRAEASRLTGRLERAEELADQRAEALAAARQDAVEGERAAKRLKDLEARILDKAAELAMLESDRAVAFERAAIAAKDLEKQVRDLTKIEMDMATLDRRRRQLEGHVETVEARLRQAEVGAAERQKRSEMLDRDVAGLAMRRETLRATLQAMKRTLVAGEPGAATELAAADGTGDAVPAPSGAAPKSQTAAVDVPPPIAPGGVEDEADDGERSRGLYRFDNLSASPEAADGEQAEQSLSTDDRGSADPWNGTAEATNWVEDQYAMGLRLLSSAEASSGTRELADAILAFKAVLGEWPKERDRMRWAIARSDLGYALALLGKRQRDAGVLEQAAAACRDALAEFRRAETPMLWAAAQHHLGVSLGGLAALRDDVGLHEASIDALEQAIAVFKDAGAEADARKAESRLREAYADLPVTLEEPAATGEAGP